MKYSSVKRSIDILLSFIGIVLSLPITIPVTILLYFANSGKPFFVQSRPGKNEKIFNLIKFKTMRDDKDENGNLLPDAARITRIGGFVRRTSMDELLQLINVLKGDMSLIGPRPLLTAYLPLYNAEQRHRHDVRPGITGWAQINGRNTISWEKKFKLDVWYVNHISFKLDAKIFFLTIKKVFKREGVDNSAGVTMPYFTGSN